jgi:rhamnulokinase
MGLGGKTLFLKNIIGMWIVQECRRAWHSAGKEFGYDELSEMAASVEPLQSFVDPADGRFAKPDRMPEKIIGYCRETGQPIPSTPAEVIRCVLESLALFYEKTIDQLEEVSGTTVKKLHIVGGGSKNALLNQLTANATGRTVLAGPVECTAIGNVLIQAIALGHVGSHEEARTIVCDSFPVTRYEPAETSQWLKASEKYQLLAQ